MQFIKKVLYFIVPFSAIFFLIHWNLETVISRSTLNGLSGFYSADGIIFGLIVAFVIQRQWEMWIKLTESVWTERDAVRELWHWSELIEGSARADIQAHVEAYLSLIVSEWQNGNVHKRSRAVDGELDALRRILSEATPAMGPAGFQAFTMFSQLVSARDKRLNLSNEHMPTILKRIVIFADVLLIIQSLFIAVDNMMIDYVFTAAISMMAFSLILVVNDLDNPFRRGYWYITTEAYESLLEELKTKK